MTQVKSGRLESLAPLFEKYNVQLYNFFLRSSCSSDESSDLVQEVFRRIIVYRESYNENNRFISWMFQIARNVRNNYFNDISNKSDKYSDLNNLDNNEFSDEENDIINDRKQNLQSAMLRLTNEQREIIELSRYQNLKYQEISEITGYSVSAIKVKMHRALNKLRQLYFELA